MGTNIFTALRVAQNEVVMCRFLADLLDPEGWHECKMKFLESFIERFVKLENVEKKNLHLERTCVMTEYLIDNGKRIDIMLQNPAFSVPIEVKINARDQQSQCYDYAFYARHSKLVYLTKDGHLPSEWSRKAKDGKKEVSKEEICCVSWEELCRWLEEAKDSNWLKKKPEALTQVAQYIAAIQPFWTKGETPCTNDCCNLVRFLLREFQNQIAKRLAADYGLELLDRSFKSYHEDVWEKKNQSLAFCPGLNYRIKGVEFPEPKNNSLQMWFRIEVAGDGYLSAGFCLANPDRGEGKIQWKVTDSAAKAAEKVGGLRFILSRDNWWFVWRFSNGKQDVDHDDVPNFKAMNQCAANLLDAQNRPDLGRLREFVEKTIQIFEDQLLQYLKSLPEQ